MLTKKIINRGEDAVDEMLDGLLLAHPTILHIDGDGRGVDYADSTG